METPGDFLAACRAQEKECPGIAAHGDAFYTKKPKSSWKRFLIQRRTKWRRGGGDSKTPREPKEKTDPFAPGFALDPDEFEATSERAPSPVAPVSEEPGDDGAGPAEEEPRGVLSRFGWGAGEKKEDTAASLVRRRTRLRFLIAREGTGEKFAEALKRLKSVKLDSLDEEGLTLAEEALGLVQASKFAGATAHKASHSATEGVIWAAKRRGIEPRGSAELVHQTVQDDQPLHEDLAAILGSWVIALPTPVRAALEFGGDILVGFSRTS